MVMLKYSPLAHLSMADFLFKLKFVWRNNEFYLGFSRCLFAKRCEKLNIILIVWFFEFWFFDHDKFNIHESSLLSMYLVHKTRRVAPLIYHCLIQRQFIQKNTKKRKQNHCLSIQSSWLFATFPRKTHWLQIQCEIFRG